MRKFQKGRFENLQKQKFKEKASNVIIQLLVSLGAKQTHSTSCAVAKSEKPTVPLVRGSYTSRKWSKLIHQHFMKPLWQSCLLSCTNSWLHKFPVWFSFSLPWSQRFSFSAKRRDKREKEAVRENLWLWAMRISLSCYDRCQLTSRDPLTSNQ